MSSPQPRRSTPAAGTPSPKRLAERDTHAMLGVLRVATTLAATTEAALRDVGAGMRASEWDLMAALYAFGPLRPVDLVRRAWMSANMPTVHAILGRLEGRGLIERRPHPLHSRGVLVELSDHGRAEVERLFPLLEHKTISVFASHFDDDELDAIAELMWRI